MVYNRGYKIACGAGHVAAKLREYARAHIRAAEHFVVNLVHLCAYEGYIGGGFFGLIGYAYAAGKVDERYFNAGFLVQFLCNGEEKLCKRGIIHVIRIAGGKEGVQAEMLHTQRLELLKAFGKLFAGEAVFRVRGVAHYGGADAELAAGIEAAGYGFGYAAVLLKEVYMRNIVQIYGGVKPARIFKILRRRIVGGEHYSVANNAYRFAKHKLGIA